MIRNPGLEILIATRNPGKVCEIEEALASLAVKLRNLEEFGNISTVAEVGDTYAENARLKAVGYSKQTGKYALADDSGLEVAALGGIPGVFSARFAGEHASDRQRIDKLLGALADSPQAQRTARFICSVAFAGWTTRESKNDGAEPQLIALTEGKCEGMITTEVRGENGFGFDPVFVPVGYESTFAELPAALKNMISHRALALAAMRKFLENWIART